MKIFDFINKHATGLSIGFGVLFTAAVFPVLFLWIFGLLFVVIAIFSIIAPFLDD